VATLGNWGYGQVAHNGRSNYLFCDGHVKALKPTQTITPVNRWTYACDSVTADDPAEPMLSAMHWLEVANP
jgi:prepilin-type processing-associated H-X9-DG protein